MTLNPCMIRLSSPRVTYRSQIVRHLIFFKLSITQSRLQVLPWIVSIKPYKTSFSAKNEQTRRSHYLSYYHEQRALLLILRKISIDKKSRFSCESLVDTYFSTVLWGAFLLLFKIFLMNKLVKL